MGGGGAGPWQGPLHVRRAFPGHMAAPQVGAYAPPLGEEPWFRRVGYTHKELELSTRQTYDKPRLKTVVLNRRMGCKELRERGTDRRMDGRTEEGEATRRSRHEWR